MPSLRDCGVTAVHHYTPLHYLPFIARSRAILNKPSLLEAGFGMSHLRSMSRGHDVERGFGNYAHLTLDEWPRILRAKLGAGFPHVAIEIPVNAVEDVSYSLCRFNVAMTRKLRRLDKLGHTESSSSGRYYPNHQIPIAKTEEDKVSMLRAHLGKGIMIEVLVHGNQPLPDNTRIVAYSNEDAKIAREVLQSTGCPWSVIVVPLPDPYPRKASHVNNVTNFIQHALTDPLWRGDGLEFDKVK